MFHLRRFAFLLCTIFFTQCGSDESDDQGRFGKVSPPLAQCKSPETCPSTGFCSPTPFQGAAAGPVAQALSVPSGYFNKTLERGHLEALANTSGVETWNYILSLGVPVYKLVEREDSSCKFHSPLADAPDDVVQRWQSFSASQGQGRSLLGLFNSKLRRSSRGGATELVDFSITVREDAERWTLLHEFQHYLYAKDRIKNPNMSWNNELLATIQQTQQRIRRLTRVNSNEPRRQNARTLTAEYEKLFATSYELDSRGPLEEFAIESLLLDNYSNGRLLWINEENDIQNAVAYMRSNQRGVLRDLERVQRSVEKHRDFVAENQWNKLTQRTDRLLKDITDVQSFINEKFERATELSFFVRGATPFRGLGHSRPDEWRTHHHFNRKLYRQKSDLLAELPAAL